MASNEGALIYLCDVVDWNVEGRENVILCFRELVRFISGLSRSNAMLCDYLHVCDTFCSLRGYCDCFALLVFLQLCSMCCLFFCPFMPVICLRERCFSQTDDFECLFTREDDIDWPPIFHPLSPNYDYSSSQGIIT